MVELERIVADLVERSERRFYGKYRGIVVDNEDPARLGRLKVMVPSVLGPDVVTGWATACVPYGGSAGNGFLFIPELRAGVWIEFEEGDLEFPIWVGTYWCKPGGNSQAPRPRLDDGTEAGDVQQSPTRRIITTVKGHTLQFEDADGSETVVVREGTRGHSITMNKDGVKIVDATGNALEMSAESMTLTAKVPLTIDAAGQPVSIVADSIDLRKG
ncbi:phage baseplate assembly protein V [Nocardia sp. NPDC050710]|uniref:phage baseplate assembly protein V n=1 Tax=Nocardia sp. NPDC050710 TaxID=3157220 RepID=UPI0034055960